MTAKLGGAGGGGLNGRAVFAVSQGNARRSHRRYGKHRIAQGFAFCLAGHRNAVKVNHIRPQLSGRCFKGGARAGAAFKKNVDKQFAAKRPCIRTWFMGGKFIGGGEQGIDNFWRQIFQG